MMADFSYKLSLPPGIIHVLKFVVEKIPLFVRGGCFCHSTSISSSKDWTAGESSQRRGSKELFIS
jgi:hypothetical protein